jgi:5-methylcytosine-specific restriction endonuclease McrA
MARERVAKWRENNPEKVRETNRKWYRSNQDKARESIRKWHQNNPEKRRALYQRRRARKAAAQVEDFSAQDLADYWESLGIDGCVYCGAPYEHADHIQPLALGGEHSRANLLPACADCNLSKGAKDPVEYVNARYGLSLEWPTDV